MSWYDRYKEEKILVHQGAEHNKFWAAHYDDKTNEVHVRWGRIGTKGQSQTKKFGSQYQAVNFIDTKFREKCRKGYKDKIDGKPIDQGVFEKLAIEAAIVGTQNKCHEMQWVEIKDAANGGFVHITEDRLFDPDCNPGLLVKIETRKEYDGDTSFRLLFSFDNCFKIGRNGMHAITKSSDLYKMAQKVEEAIGRNLSS